MQRRLPKQGVGWLVSLLMTASACGTGPRHDAQLKASITAGEGIYKQHCLTCHMANGAGAARMNPPLIGTSFVTGNPDQLIPIVLKGMSNTPIDGETYRGLMPPFEFLTDDEIANVLTYIRNSFGNSAGLITKEDVRALR